MIEERLRESIRVIQDFPIQGITFKDLTPVFKDAKLCNDILLHFKNCVKNHRITAIVGIESRGFFMAPALAFILGITFVPVRKKGKLPFTTYTDEYELEYGTDSLEIHTDALTSADRVLIHDDVLATGGTAASARRLVEKCGADPIAYAFLIELQNLKGREKLSSNNIYSITTY